MTSPDERQPVSSDSTPRTLSIAEHALAVYGKHHLLVWNDGPEGPRPPAPCPKSTGHQTDEPCTCGLDAATALVEAEAASREALHDWSRCYGGLSPEVAAEHDIKPHWLCVGCMFGDEPPLLAASREASPPASGDALLALRTLLDWHDTLEPDKDWVLPPVQVWEQARAALAASPPPEGLDVERLTEAMQHADQVCGADPAGVEDYRTLAEEVATEYARLQPDSREGAE